MKPKSMILLGVSGLFGLVAAALFTTAMGQPSGTGPTKAVLIVSEELEIGSQLNDKNCRLEQWPQNIIPEGIVGSFEEIADKRLNTRLSKNTPVFTRDLLDKHDRVLVTVPPGKKVVGLKLPAEDHIAGLLQPGHTVDIIGIFVHEEKSFSKTILRGIKVYSVSNKTALESGENTKSNEDDITVSLVVSERQSEMLTLVSSTANIKLAVRGMGDTDVEQSEVESQKGPVNLLDMIGFEKPVIPTPLDPLPKQPQDKPFRMQFFRGDFAYLYEFTKDGAVEVSAPARPTEEQPQPENP
ncbi:MAG: Flp pilus assembly protein CpaB [Pirellulaceae bacterium]|nr:Flp pilus assembly protein CpaB [Pirellulaceae bacterium]